MCGIAGFVAPPGVRADRTMLEGMVRTLAHRGPDTFGYHVDGPAAIGIGFLALAAYRGFVPAPAAAGEH